MTEYKFEPYDVLQVSRDGKHWDDYGTLRTEEEARYAVRYVKVSPFLDSVFRIKRGAEVVYSK